MRWFSIVFVHLSLLYSVCVFFFFNQKTAYEMRISDWSSDVCSSDLLISGIGSVNKLGAGTVIFSADNSYTGITTIAAGVLQLGGGGTTGSIAGNVVNNRSEEHTSELQSLMRISYAVFCLKKKKKKQTTDAEIKKNNDKEDKQTQ